MKRNIYIGTLVGKTIVKIDGLEVSSRSVEFICDNGEKYCMYHSQDCYESVSIDDINGDISDLIGTPITQAEEKDSSDFPAPKNAESYTWTFYTIATIKGYVDIKWLGESNGYYSEGVDFKQEA